MVIKDIYCPFVHYVWQVKGKRKVKRRDYPIPAVCQIPCKFFSRMSKQGGVICSADKKIKEIQEKNSNDSKTQK